MRGSLAQLGLYWNEVSSRPTTCCFRLVTNHGGLGSMVMPPLSTLRGNGRNGAVTTGSLGLVEHEAVVDETDAAAHVVERVGPGKAPQGACARRKPSPVQALTAMQP